MGLAERFREAWEANGPERKREPAFTPSSWSGALIVMCGFTAVFWIVNIVNAANDYSLNRFGLRPRQVSGLWGVLTQPFLHADYSHLLSNTAPLLLVGWVLLLSGLRNWLIVTATVIVVGGFATWVVAPSGLIVGASGLVFGWLGYLIARAYFARTFKGIMVAVVVLFFFGTLLGKLLPSFDTATSWQSHLCGFLTGIAVAAVLHPRRARGQQGSTRILAR